MDHLKEALQRPELVFLLLASFFGGASVFLMPILQTPDENQHFQVAYSVFSANKGPAKDLLMQDGDVLKDIRQNKYSDYFTVTSSAKSDGLAVNPHTTVFGRAHGSVFDITRLPQALGILLARLTEPSVWFMVIMGRLFNLAVYVAALYFIIKKVRYSKWAFVFIALTPMMIQQAASLSYDPMNLIAIFAWVAFVINLVTQKSKITRNQLLIAIPLIALLLATKSNNAVLLLLALVVPVKHVTQAKLYRKVQSLNYWKLIKYVAIAGIVAIACAALYIMGKKLLAGHEFHPIQLLSVLLNTFLWGNLGLIDATAIGIIGQFSNFNYHMPGWIVIISITVLAIIMMQDSIPKVSKRFAIVSGILFVASVLLIAIGMYYAWAMKPVRLGPAADVTDGIQGRYFTPLLVLLVPTLSYVNNFIKTSVKNTLTIPTITTVTSIFLLSVYLLQTWHFFWK